MKYKISKLANDYSACMSVEEEGESSSCTELRIEGN
jgi:hypothetical protein